MWPTWIEFTGVNEVTIIRTKLNDFFAVYNNGVHFEMRALSVIRVTKYTFKQQKN